MKSLPFLVAAPAIALIAFGAPPYGLHARLDAEKARLQGEAAHRLKALLTALILVIQGVLSRVLFS